MRKYLLILMCAALFAVFPGCSSKNSGYSVNTSESDNIAFGDPAETGPLLMLTGGSAEPGGIAELKLSVANTTGWTFCGLHMIYPKELDCVLEDPDDPKCNDAVYDEGEAIHASDIGIYSRRCADGFSKEVDSSRFNGIFFTTVCSNDTATDGTIAVFKLKIPDDAVPGTKYNVDFYFADTDAFTKADDGDGSYQAKAFENAKGTVITVR